MENIQPFLDDQGKIKIWPAKQQKKLAVLLYMSEKFTPGKSYTEKEVNTLITHWHTFNDLFVLRRGMVEMSFLKRTPNGSKYWRPDSPVEASKT